MAFLNARLDEDERELVKDPPVGLGYANLAARIRRDVEAKRAILDQLATDLSYSPPVPSGHQRAWAIASLIVEALTTVYSDHPDYRPEWKP